MANQVNNIDLLDIVATFSETAKRLLNNQDLEKVEVDLKLNLPKYLVTSATTLSPMLQMPSSEVLARIIEGAIEEELNRSKKVSQEVIVEKDKPAIPAGNPSDQLNQFKELFGSMGIDLSGFTNSFKKLDDVVGQLRTMQEASESIYGNPNTQGKNNKNPK